MEKGKKLSRVVLRVSMAICLFAALPGLTYAAPVPIHSGPQFVDGYYADPDVQNYNGTYWVYPTRPSQVGEPPSTGAKSMDIFSSTDLVNWTKYSNVISSANISWLSHALWAPSGAYRDGKYYIYFAANAINGDGQLGGIGVAVADHPEGPYTDAIGAPLINVVRNGAGPMDQDVFIDDDGQAYMYYGSWGEANVVKLNADMKSLGTWPDGTVYKKVTPAKTGNNDFFEGPKVFKRNGIYYMTYSAGLWVDSTYKVLYATSDSVTGPFVPKGIMLHSDATTAYGPGHNGIIKSPDSGNWYIFYHKRYLNKPDWDARVLAYDKFEFSADNSIIPVEMAVGDNFNDGNDVGWTKHGGTWTVSGGQYHVASNPGAKALLDTNFSNMVYEADVTPGATGNAGLVFRVSNPGTGADAYQGYYAGLDVPNQRVVIGKANNNWTSLATAPMSLSANTTYPIKIVAQDTSIRVYVGDMATPKLSVTDSSYIGGKIGVRTYNSAAKFDNISVESSQYETENIMVSATSGDKHLLFGEGSGPDPNLSGGYGVMLEADAVHDYVTYTVNVPEARSYSVKVRVKKGPGRGQFQMSVNGVNHGSVQDLYANSLSYAELSVANITFSSAGQKSFKFNVAGKNNASSGYFLGLDYIKLVPN
ncbi:family 43 glycosylhydrolase [Paenibacillus senegalimassiliensis]|uniref:family 43 glycosylhydrolase n=1 Tax=Paenibacillus senegalimassiliensis TaxID=1737426 RepID=UPI000A7FA8C4|nr:family 43 glycosylhydrolase [Paenibacillus senegalimassiliensis]